MGWGGVGGRSHCFLPATSDDDGSIQTYVVDAEAVCVFLAGRRLGGCENLLYGRPEFLKMTSCIRDRSGCLTHPHASVYVSENGAIHKRFTKVIKYEL